MSICPCICQTGPLHSDVINRVVCPVTCSSWCKRPSLDCQTRDIPAPQNINPDNNNSNISSIITLKHVRNPNIFTVIHKHMHLFSKKQNLFIKTFIKCLLSWKLFLKFFLRLYRQHLGNDSVLVWSISYIFVGCNVSSLVFCSFHICRYF